MACSCGCALYSRDSSSAWVWTDALTRADYCMGLQSASFISPVLPDPAATGAVTGFLTEPASHPTSLITALRESLRYGTSFLKHMHSLMLPGSHVDMSSVHYTVWSLLNPIIWILERNVEDKWSHDLEQSPGWEWTMTQGSVRASFLLLW